MIAQAQLAQPERYLEVLSQLVEAQSQPLGDGLFLEVHDSAGHVIMRYGFASRVARTVAWVEPDLLRRY